MNVKIIGIGHHLPNKCIINDDLPATLNTNDEWIKTRTGINQRFIAEPGILSSDLATEALKNALADSNIDPKDLDGIIVATTTPDLLMPATAVKVQYNIGMKNGFAFDIQAVCSGFLYALKLGYSLIKSGEAKNIAIIGAETMSRIIDWSDRSTCILFGDGAGAVILSKANTEGIIGIDLYSDGSYIDILKVAGGVSKGDIDSKLQMSGKEVFKFAVENMHRAISNIMTKYKVNISDIDWLIPHQANSRIIQMLAQQLNFDIEKVVLTVDEHANTSSASIPLALSSYKDKGLIKSGNLALLVAVGAGMTWGSALLRI
jgi:3-oxoacyl-[acyl-carrier-protein] synthase-3